ncbi:MAG: 2-isopropylmalate synthase [Oscillospiraceae bacterium]
MSKRQIKIFDTTMRDGEQSPGCSMNLNEKVQLAKQLELLGVDVIEAGFPITSNDDFNAVSAIASTVKDVTVAALARAVTADIDCAFNALKSAKKPRLHIFIATSDIHLEYKLKMTREEVLLKTRESVEYAKTLLQDVEFSAEDASRSDKDFLLQVVQTAINAGATTINIPDTVGYSTPQEMFSLIKFIKDNAKGIENVDIATHCHDDLGLATACSMAAILAGATQVECTVSGIGERAGNAAMEEIVMGIFTRSDFYGCYCNINTKQIYKTSKMLSTIIGVGVSANKSVIGANAFSHESGIHQHGMLAFPKTYQIMSPDLIGIPQNRIVLGKHSGKHAFNDRLVTLGYILSSEQLDETFVSFKQLADKKKEVTDSDIEALVSSHSFEKKKKFEFIRFVINSGNTITSTASVQLKVDEQIVEKVATGEGPINACFCAIDKISKLSITLENYTIQSVTAGRDALGEVVVKIKYNDNTITGRGLSTDIIEASIKAYLNAINKIM